MSTVTISVSDSDQIYQNSGEAAQHNIPFRVNFASLKCCTGR